MAEVCWHDDRRDWRHYRVCPVGDGGKLIIWGRCRSGRRWFWSASIVGDDRGLYGWAETEDAAVGDARAAVEKLAHGDPAIASVQHGSASRRLKAVNAERRKRRPGQGSNAGAVEYLYGVNDGHESNNFQPSIVTFRITKKTPKRVYYVRREGWPGEDPVIGFVDRHELESKGEVVNHGSGGWWADDFHLYAQPPDIRLTANERVDLRQLRREMAEAHPDRGGSSEAFIAARGRYERAKGGT